MPTAIKLVGAWVAVVGLIAKIQGLRSAPAEALVEGFDYVVLVVGLALVILGFAFTFFMNGDKTELAGGRGPGSKGASSSAS